MADRVRVLARSIMRGQAILHCTGEKVQAGFEDRTQQAKQLAHQIGESVRRKQEAAQMAGKQAYQELLAVTERSLVWADQTKKQLSERSQQSTKRLVETLSHFIPLVRQVSQQATQWVLQGEQVPSSEKLVSLFEEHTDIIRRGKESRPVEYGHKFWLNEVEGGLVSRYRILDGNPSDEPQWKSSLKAHLVTFHQPPVQASADRGLFSEPNEQLAHELGVKHVILPKHGHHSHARLKHEHKAWFVKGRHWHAGVEGRISVLKRAHGSGRCLAHGFTGFQCWVAWAVIAGNLAVLGRT